MLNQNHNSQCIRLLKVNTLDTEATSGGLVSNSIYQYLKEVNTSPLNIALHIFKVLWNKSDESNLQVIWLESSKFSFNILTIGISHATYYYQQFAHDPLGILLTLNSLLHNQYVY